MGQAVREHWTVTRAREKEYDQNRSWIYGCSSDIKSSMTSVPEISKQSFLTNTYVCRSTKVLLLKTSFSCSCKSEIPQISFKVEENLLVMLQGHFNIVEHRRRYGKASTEQLR